MRQMPLFPVTVVGSLPRPQSLLDAVRQARSGQLEPEALEREIARAVEAAVRMQEECGVDVVSDGEQGRPDFYSFIAGRLAGLRLLTLQDLAEQHADPAAVDRLLRSVGIPSTALQLPVVVGRLERKAPLALHEFLRVQRLTDRPVKVALPGPYLLTRSAWVQALSSEHYPAQEALARDVVSLLRRELEDLAEAGCAFVQFDEPALGGVAFSGPEEGDAPTDPGPELDFAVDLVNRVVEGFQDLRTGLHVCRGRWDPGDRVCLRGSYDALIPYFARMNVRQFVLEYAGEQAGSLERLASLPPDREIGLGVLNPRTAELEPVETVISKARELARHVSPERIFLNPDCGFGTFANRPVNTIDGAAAKLRVLALAARRLRARLGPGEMPAELPTPGRREPGTVVESRDAPASSGPSGIAAE